MKPLPVPPLSETMDRLAHAVEAVASPGQARQTRERIADFLAGPGPALQDALADLATEEDAAGRSWLSEDWLQDYLRVRDPLPLSTNVAFQLAGDFPGAEALEGVERAAELMRRVASVHLAQARGETPQETDARGNRMDMAQWECLNGGIRHPHSGADLIIRSTLDGACREAGVFAGGRLFAVRVSDEAGQPLPLSAFCRALAEIMGLTGIDASGGMNGKQGEDAAGGGAAGETASSSGGDGQGIAGFSVLGSDVLAPLLDGLLAEEENASTYQRLTDFLFTVTLVPEPREEADHLRELAFVPGHVWVRKPISYEIGLADGWWCLHAEHSTVDGATLLAAVGRIQEAPEGAPESDVEAGADASVEAGREDHDAAPESRPLDSPAPEELGWRFPEALRREAEAAVAEVRHRAEDFRVALVRVPGLPESVRSLPFKVSGDAAMQLVMTTAQLLTGHAPRGTYEAVDMREYQAGRTECLRPVTPEAVAFGRALAQAPNSDPSSEDPGDAQDLGQLEELLAAAMDAHRGWVKACKAGKGFDRHLLGLERVAVRRGVDHPLFHDAGAAAVRENFLSTTSIGGADRIIRYAFVPAVADGYGISYTPVPDGFEYCVVWDRTQARQPEAFLEALERAGRMLHALLEDLAERGTAPMADERAGEQA